MPIDMGIKKDIPLAKKELERSIKRVGLERFVTADKVERWLTADDNKKDPILPALSMLTGLMDLEVMDDETAINKLCDSIIKLYNAHRQVALKAKGKKTEFSGIIEIQNSRLPPDDWVDDYEMGVNLLRKNKFDKAADRFDNMFKELLRANTTVPDVYRIFYNAGGAYLFSGKPDLGRQCMLWALDLNPNYPFCRQKLKELENEDVKELMALGILQKRLKDFEARKKERNLDRVISWSTKRCMTELKKLGVHFELDEFLTAAKKLNSSAELARTLFEPRAREAWRHDDLHWMAALSIWMRECPTEPARDVLDEFLDHAEKLLDEMDFKIESKNAISKYGEVFEKLEKILLTTKKNFHNDWKSSFEYVTKGKFVLFEFLCTIVAEPVFAVRVLSLAKYLERALDEPSFDLIKIAYKIAINDPSWETDYVLVTKQQPYEYWDHVLVSKSLVRVGNIDRAHEVLLNGFTAVDNRRKDRKFDLDSTISTIYEDYKIILEYLSVFYENYDIEKPRTDLMTKTTWLLKKEKKALQHSELQEQFDSESRNMLTKIIEKEIEESPVYLYYRHLRELDINFKTKFDVETVESKIPFSPGLEFKSGSSRPKKRKVGRNDPCPCGSGKKYKKCCLGKEKV